MPSVELGDYPDGANNSSYDVEVGDTYEYPGGIDFTPGSKAHEKIKQEVLRRARDSRDHLSKQYPYMRDVDETLSAYIDIDENEQKDLDEDMRIPVSIVIPVSYSMLETMLTYMMAYFVGDNNEIFQIDGRNSEDTIGAIKLERILAVQSQNFKHALSLYTALRDSFAYGFGVVAPIWDSHYFTKEREQTTGFTSYIDGTFKETGVESFSEDVLAWEGNRLHNISVYDYLPDPMVPIHDIQRAEYVGMVMRTNLSCLLSEEQEMAPERFNGDYLRRINHGRSRYGSDYDKGRNPRVGNSRNNMGSADTSKPIDVIFMYIKVIPKEWGIGDSEYPEKWLFGLAGDDIVIQAQPLGLWHNLFPIGIFAPNFDGYSNAPTSHMTLINGMQRLIDWFFNSHVTNVRKSINDMLIVDPLKINMNDLYEGGPGKIVRLRKSGWGSGVDGAVQQLKIADITQRHVTDAMIVQDLVQRVLGITDQMQGAISDKKERVQAGEVHAANRSGASRLAKTAKILGLQGMHDLTLLCALQTQQLMSEGTTVKALGRRIEELQAEYGEDVSKISVEPRDIDVAFDIIIGTNGPTGSENVEAWTRLLDMLLRNPEAANSLQIDLRRAFLHGFKLAGANSIYEFMQKTNTSVQVQGEEQIAQGVQSGQLQPVR